MDLPQNGSWAALQTRVFLGPIGSPLPLGLLALMCAGLLLSLEGVGAFPASDSRTIGLILLGFVVPLELLASVLSFVARDGIAGTALGLFGGAWLATGLNSLTATPGSTSAAFGAFMIALAASFAVAIGGAAFGKAGPAAVVVLGSARLLLFGLYNVSGSAGLEHAAGIVGFALAAAALYSALATELEDIHGDLRLPMGRRARAREALAGPWEKQLDRLDREPGVRQQL